VGAIKFIFALDIPPESDAAKYMCPKTLWSMRQKVTDQELDTVLFQQATHKPARVFAVDTTRSAWIRCTSGPTCAGWAAWES